MKQLGIKSGLTAVFITGLILVGNAQTGSVSIDQDRKITQLLDIYRSVNSTARYYTVQIGFGSYEKAEELKAEADVDFPGWYSKIVFDSPTYRVHVGRFRTKLEAERKFLEVRKKYPASLLLNPEKEKKK